MRFTGISTKSMAVMTALGAALALSSACNKDQASTEPGAGDNLLGPSGGVGGTSEDAFGEGEDEMFADDELGDGEEVARAQKKELPPKADPVKKCRGKGKKRECSMVDPKPKVSASYGVQALMGGFGWGMTPKQVYRLLSEDIEAEYTKRQEQAKDAMTQDRARRWRQDQLAAIKANHTKFTAASKHRWGVSLIQHEYENDANEEMLWVKTGTGLRKFYFFKDDELWKVFYAYSTDVWPGMSYADVVEEKFKKWFGVSPEEKVKQDPETGAPIIRYNEWESMDGERIRSFDLTQVHGVIGLAVIDGSAEDRIGQRLPKIQEEKGNYEGVVDDVLGGTDVCYKDDGSIVECSETEALGVE